ncbi:hypothetical protein EVAR_94041_1 [Eumeta japonica]|uniref:Uncharacterized protein n=1 Tax=Eumeta variegata TaxID=151549 RepID=A0A4C1V5Y3_EUMVA|nr:hypothetical protein EVAR_94041_1 [Eumeta japonica]
MVTAARGRPVASRVSTGLMEATGSLGVPSMTSQPPETADRDGQLEVGGIRGAGGAHRTQTQTQTRSDAARDVRTRPAAPELPTLYLAHLYANSAIPLLDNLNYGPRSRSARAPQRYDRAERAGRVRPRRAKTATPTDRRGLVKMGASVEFVHVSDRAIVLATRQVIMHRCSDQQLNVEPIIHFPSFGTTSSC